MLISICVIVCLFGCRCLVKMAWMMKKSCLGSKDAGFYFVFLTPLSKAMMSSQPFLSWMTLAILVRA